MKSQCCNAEIEEIKCGEGIFVPTTGALICSSCKKYCVREKDWTGNKKSTFSTPLKSAASFGNSLLEAKSW